VPWCRCRVAGAPPRPRFAPWLLPCRWRPLPSPRLGCRFAGGVAALWWPAPLPRFAPWLRRCAVMPAAGPRLGCRAAGAFLLARGSRRALVASQRGQHRARGSRRPWRPGSLHRPELRLPLRWHPPRCPRIAPRHVGGAAPWRPSPRPRFGCRALVPLPRCWSPPPAAAAALAAPPRPLFAPCLPPRRWRSPPRPRFAPRPGALVAPLQRAQGSRCPPDAAS
jgi:hypothetical protein